MPADRIDVHRNREALLRSAAGLFATEGSGVPLAKVAANAGLGVGTLYRHFPNRAELVSATFGREIERLGAIDDLLADHTGVGALTIWLARFIDFVEAKSAIADVLHAPTTPAHPSARGTVTATMDALLALGATDGTLRPDVNADDLLRATEGFWLAQGDANWRPGAERLMRLIVDGLRV